MLDVEKFIGGIHDYIGRAVAPISSRLKAVEDQIKAIPAGADGAPGRDGRDGINGKDATVDSDAIAAQVLAKIPAPKDGQPGANG
ncbi:MAG: hypothetical protein WC023_15070, partial [Rhodocyclaceae bacterium]